MSSLSLVKTRNRVLPLENDFSDYRYYVDLCHGLCRVGRPDSVKDVIEKSRVEKGSKLTVSYRLATTAA